MFERMTMLDGRFREVVRPSFIVPKLSVQFCLKEYVAEKGSVAIALHRVEVGFRSCAEI